MDKWCLQGGNAGEKLLYCVIINAHLISNINMQQPSMAASSTNSLRMCLVLKTRMLSWKKKKYWVDKHFQHVFIVAS